MYQLADQSCVIALCLVASEPAGKVLRQWGGGQFMMPHMITVDHNNSVWVVDAGRHQVLKFTAAGRFILQVGKKDKPANTRFQLCQPTQVGRQPSPRGM